MAEINWTSEAENWLRDIYDYIAQENPSAAEKIVNAIYDKAQFLQQFPYMGYRYNPSSQDDIRILLYGHYRIAYLIKPDKNIDIIGVFHGSLAIERYFK